jgi:integrase
MSVTMPRRRTKGSGSIRKRGRIFWITYYVNGRAIAESAHTSDKEAASKLLQQRLGEVAAGRIVGPNKITIADVCRLVVEDYRLRGLRDVNHIEWRIGSHIEPLLGSIQAARFGTAQVKQYIERRRQDGASNGSINRELAIVRRGFTLGRREDPPLIVREPTIPKLDEGDPRQAFLEQEQYERLLDEMPARLKALLVCGYHTGARKGELRRIRWEQVDFDAAVIRLSGGQTKGKRPRTLPVYGDMEMWLRRQQETCPEGCPFVFHGRLKRPVDNHLDGWAEACERAGVPGLLFHDLRRSAVRNMKRSGIQDGVAMAISGHKTRSVFDRYNIVDEGELKSAGESLEEYARQRKAERAAKLKRVK